MDEYPNHLPVNLLRLGRARALTQSALADLSGLSPSLISMIERGRGSNVRATTIVALGRALGVNPGDLLAEPPTTISLPGPLIKN